jgi:hypothetical protein
MLCCILISMWIHFDNLIPQKSVIYLLFYSYTSDDGEKRQKHVV